MSYKRLEIYKLARECVINIHEMSLGLPGFEMYEVGSQIRRSAKSTRANIVEGYGRRRYKNDFIRFLVYAHASNDETLDHLETLFETGSLRDEKIYQDLKDKLNILGRMIYRFIESIEKKHKE